MCIILYHHDPIVQQRPHIYIYIVGVGGYIKGICRCVDGPTEDRGGVTEGSGGGEGAGE